jgi:hypothetical protein
LLRWPFRSISVSTAWLIPAGPHFMRETVGGDHVWNLVGNRRDGGKFKIYGRLQTSIPPAPRPRKPCVHDRVLLSILHAGAYRCLVLMRQSCNDKRRPQSVRHRFRARLTATATSEPAPSSTAGVHRVQRADRRPVGI